MNYIVKIKGDEITKEKNTDCDAPSQIIRSSNIIIDYHWHKDTEPLTNAIKNESWILETDLMKQFVALICSGKYKPLKKGFIKKSTVAKRRKAFAQFMYYRQAGVPIYACRTSYDKDEFSCAALACKDAHISDFTLRSEILAGRSLDDVFELWTPITDGHCIKVLNNGIPPNSIEELKKLERIKYDLTQEESRDIFNHYMVVIGGGVVSAKNTWERAERVRKKYKLKDKKYKFIPNKPCGKCENCMRR